MRRLIDFTLIVLLFAQPKLTLAQEWLSMVCTFSSGAFDGTAETLKFHYPKFKQRFSGANDQYWNPNQSWTNKYKPGTLEPKYFGSTTFLVWTTDGYHQMRMLRNTSVSFAIALHPTEKKKWWMYAMDAAGHLLAYQVGFTLAYDVIFK